MPHAFAWPAAALIAGVACGITLGFRRPLQLLRWYWRSVLQSMRTRAATLSVSSCWCSLDGSRRALPSGPVPSASPRHRHCVRLSSGTAASDLQAASTRPLAPAAARIHPSAVPLTTRSRHPPPRYRGRTHDPDQVVTIVGRLRQDAAVLPQGVGLSIEVEELPRGPATERVSGGAMLTVLGSLAAARIQIGVRDASAGAGDAEGAGAVPGPGRAGPGALARAPGTALVGSVKSGALVDVVARGSWLEELAASARHRIRQLRWRASGRGIRRRLRS